MHSNSFKVIHCETNEIGKYHCVRLTDCTVFLRFFSPSSEIIQLYIFGVVLVTETETNVLYTYGFKDFFTTSFYFLICIVVHAVVQEYILDVSVMISLFVYGRPSGSAGSAFCFPYNSVTVRRILFKFGRFRQSFHSVKFQTHS